MKRVFLALVVLVIGGGFAAWEFGLLPHASPATDKGVGAQGATRADATPPAVTVVSTTRRLLEERVLVTGTLVARTDVLVAPEIEGLRIMSLEADIGDRVTKGQVLARLERETLELVLAQREAAIARARAAIAQGRSAITQAEARQKEAANALQRGQSLKSSGFLSESILDQRETAARTAQAALVSARDGLALAEADQQQAEALHRDTAWRIGRTEIRSPVAGLVSNRNARIGGVAAAVGEPMFRVIADGEIELEADVPEVDIVRLQAGQTALVDVPGGPAVQGVVRLVSPEVERTTRLGKVRISLRDAAVLRVGSFARGTVVTARRESLAIPVAAVQFGNGRTSVQRVDGDRIATHTVVTGLKSGSLIEIREGLSSGDKVVAKAGTFLRNGDRINAVEGQTNAAEVN